MRQYLELKEQTPDCILLFRMGDFYEMFLEDAKVASKVLGIALTSRDKNKDPIPMCGVPHHALEQYLAMLVEAGFKVAICEQVEDPKQAKGLVKREIIRVVSPGMYTNPERIASKDHRYVAAVYFQKQAAGLAFLDLSSGEFVATNVAGAAQVAFELARLEPWELIMASGQDAMAAQLGEMAGLPRTLVNVPELQEANQLLAHLLNNSPQNDDGAAFIAAAMLWNVVLETQRCKPEHIRELSFYEINSFLTLDHHAIRNLELFRSIMEGGRKGSLLHSIDHTHTPMGARLLKDWLLFPLRDKCMIEARQQGIAQLGEARLTLEDLVECLKAMPDLPRLMGRIGMGQAGPRDMASLRGALQMLPRINALLEPMSAPLLKDSAAMLRGMDDLCGFLETILAEDPPLSLSDGGVIAQGVNARLDELRALARQGKSWVSELQHQLRTKTGIHSLKVGFNRVFGYYIEVSKTHQQKVPPEFMRKQTLAGGERYITMELKEKEAAILGAEEGALALETALFNDLRDKVAANSAQLMALSRALARLDVLCGLALLAYDKGYVRPLITDDGVISISGGRHPVVESVLKPGEFVPNDVFLDNTQEVLIITGPNMAGKSTILRQIAIISILGQMGSFVPAEKASLTLLDRIFTRVGAMDNLAKGQSTFMTEMVETAQILKEATPDSLVILDEVGRGTSTFDGLSLAWAIVEFLHNLKDVGVKTLFATHYHELTEIAATCPRVRNFNVEVKEFNNNIVFMRRLVPGGVSRSYGLQVAKLAGIPGEVLKRARGILRQLERENALNQELKFSPQISLFEGHASHTENPVVERLRGLDTSAITPLAALNLLEELKRALD